MIDTAVLIAGGMATRLGALVRDLPKSLVEVAGTPFIAHQLRLLQRNGIGSVLLCVGHQGEKIERFVGDGAAFGLRVEYAYDGPRLLGTGGALLQALPKLPDAFLALYGDSYLDADYRPALRAFEAGNAPALMTVIRNEGRWGESNAQYDEGRVLRYDKRRRTAGMDHFDYGLLLFRRKAFDGASTRRPLDLADVLGPLADEGLLLGHEMTDPLFEIGSPDGLDALRRHLSPARQP
ncbi:MAG: sugar phosphate nucleotidyltransferase [Elusimicrobiota bacterium]